MQAMGRLGSLAILVLWAGSIPAQPSSTQTITANEVEVRSGPSPTFYAVSKLHRGDPVQVVREEQGWIAIEPPRGAFSWISTQNVDWLGNWQGAVKSTEAKIRIGSRLPPNQPPTVEPISVPRGTIVTILDNPQWIDNVPWYPILPTAKEVRYIPLDAIRTNTAPPPQGIASPSYNSPNSPSAVSRSDGVALQQSAWGAPTNGFALPNQNQGTTDPLWIEADKAERAGNFVYAIELYERLATQVATTNPDLRLQCLNRGTLLRDRLRAASYALQQQSARVQQTNAAQTAQPNLGYDPRWGTSQNPPAASSNVVSQQVSPNNTVATGDPMPDYTELGELYLSGIPAIQGKTVYGFKDMSGNVIAYAVEENGVNLAVYAHRRVRLYGITTYNADLKRNLITVKRASVQ